MAYARFSSDNQRQESIDAQLRAIKEYCDRNSMILLDAYKDEALSGTTDKREQFLQMISDSKEGKFDVVIVHKLDRFSRDRYDSAFYKRELRKNSVSLCSVLENLDDSPESIIMESVLTGMAEYYSANLAREVMKGMKETAYQCKHTGGLPPYGYKVNSDTRKYEILEHEAEAVRFIFQSALEGKSYDMIIRELNARGYRTRRGISFGKNSLHEILRNEKYIGVYTFNLNTSKDVYGKRNNHSKKDELQAIRVPGGMPAIIDEPTFNGVSSMMQGRKKTSVNHLAQENYLLSGKIICGECGKAFGGGRKFSGRNKALYVTYRCCNRDRTGDTACRNKEIQRDYLERFVINELSNIIFSNDDIPGWINKYRRYIEENSISSISRINEMEKESKHLDQQIENIALAIAQSNSVSKTLLTSLEKLEAKKDEVDQVIQEAWIQAEGVMVTEEEMREYYQKARELFITGELPEMRQLINLYLEKVVVYREYVEVFLHVLPSFCLTNKAKLELMEEKMDMQETSELVHRNSYPTFRDLIVGRKALMKDN